MGHASNRYPAQPCRNRRVRLHRARSRRLASSSGSVAVRMKTMGARGHCPQRLHRAVAVLPRDRAVGPVDDQLARRRFGGGCPRRAERFALGRERAQRGRRAPVTDHPSILAIGHDVQRRGAIGPSQVPVSRPRRPRVPPRAPPRPIDRDGTGLHRQRSRPSRRRPRGPPLRSCRAASPSSWTSSPSGSLRSGHGSTRLMASSHAPIVPCRRPRGGAIDAGPKGLAAPDCA